MYSKEPHQGGKDVFELNLIAIGVFSQESGLSEQARIAGMVSVVYSFS